MNHEPECTFLNEPESVNGSCWCCAGIRAAYQRGIDDASKSIHERIQKAVKELLEIPPFTTVYEYQKQQATGMVKAFETVRQIKSDINVTITSHSRPLKVEPKSENN